MNRWLDRLMAKVIRQGRLEVTWSDGSTSAYGNGTGRAARIEFRDRATEWAVLVNPELAIGEAYMDGSLVFPDDTLLEFLMLLNESWTALSKRPFYRALAGLRFVTRRVAQNNSPMRARRNIKHHYDLDGRLYRLFLDSDMQYSCAYFERPDATLEEAQWAKKRHLAAKLALKPGPDGARHRLRLGRPWAVPRRLLRRGGHRRHALRRAAQGSPTTAPARRASSSHARFELQGLPHLDTTFDRIVSVGMFEHVGAARYREFFRAASKLLKPDGVMVLHSIGRFGPPTVTNPWIAKYIFPGGYIPACRR